MKENNSNIKKPITTKTVSKNQESKLTDKKVKDTTSQFLIKHDPNENYALRMVDIHKSFLNGMIKANVGINLLIKENSIHAIIGENGAGKSTLMSILFGMYEPDQGEIYIRNQKVSFKSSKDASAHKIGMVHQHFKLVDNFTVLENIILGQESSNSWGFLNKSKDKKKIQEIINKYNFDIDVNKKISQLTVGQQQRVEILKVLFRDSEIIIFDEPTAVLSDKEIELFLEIVKQFQKDGKTIIIISHKLHEIKQVASEATVIRKGEYVATIDVKKASIEQMAELMVGRKVVQSVNKLPCKREEVILEVNNLNLNHKDMISSFLVNLKKSFIKSSFGSSLRKAFKWFDNWSNNELMVNSTEIKPVSFKIHAGEIFAISGIEGNGQSAIVEFIAGLRKSNLKSIMFLGNDLSVTNPNKRIQKGVSHVPEDRHKYGLDLEETTRLNIVANRIEKRPFSNKGFLVEYEIAQYANNIINKYDVRGSANGLSLAKSLSGGNQQKVIIGREIEKDHKLIIMAQPTRGLDIGAIEFIHKEIIKEKEKGNAILLISYELDEILALADTIAVISKNKIIDQGSREVMTRQKIGNLLAGERM